MVPMQQTDEDEVCSESDKSEDENNDSLKLKIKPQSILKQTGKPLIVELN